MKFAVILEEGENSFGAHVPDLCPMIRNEKLRRIGARMLLHGNRPTFWSAATRRRF